VSVHCNDIEVNCDHGNEGGRCDHVRLYRWITSQATWVPIDGSGNALRYLHGNRSATSTEDFATPPRGKHEVQCKICHSKLSARGNGIQIVLAKLAAAGVTEITLSRLRRAYNTIPQRAR
jgi:hypothetical protein